MSKTKAAELYGPNTVAVQAIIERAGKLTHDEVLALHAARDAAWTAAGAAAWTAARAAVVRDLITPEQYAVLAGPWESVIT